MALLEDMFEGKMGAGLAIAGAAVLAPTVLPMIGRVARPLAKTAIKTGMMLYRETLSSVGDMTGDVIAEARSELEEESHSSSSHRRTAAPSKA